MAALKCLAGDQQSAYCLEGGHEHNKFKAVTLSITPSAFAPKTKSGNTFSWVMNKKTEIWLVGFEQFERFQTIANNELRLQ